jgi:hypothetical protein
MNPDPSKLRQQHREEEQTAALHQSTQKQQGREFATVEELIRCDVEQTPVPPQIAERLIESIAQEPKPVRSWWRRFFSGNR